MLFKRFKYLFFKNEFVNNHLYDRCVLVDFNHFLKQLKLKIIQTSLLRLSINIFVRGNIVQNHSYFFYYSNILHLT